VAVLNAGIKPRKLITRIKINNVEKKGIHFSPRFSPIIGKTISSRTNNTRLSRTNVIPRGFKTGFRKAGIKMARISVADSNNISKWIVIPNGRSIEGRKGMPSKILLSII
jgi:hypothetical protein